MKNFFRLRKVLLFTLILIAVFLPLIITNSYDRHVLVLVLMYAILGSAWNILGGYAGQVSFGNAVFFGIGAYTSTVMVAKAGISPWIGIVAGMVLSVTLAILIGLPFFRLQSQYFVIATTALLLIVQTLLTRWRFVNGAAGIRVPLIDDSWLMFQFYSKLPYYYVLLIYLIITVLIINKIIKSKIGYYLRTIKQNQDAAESLGVDTRKYKLFAIMICAAISAGVGTIYAQYFLFLDPANVVSQDISLLMVLVSVFGGVETIAGPILGASLLIPIAEYSRSKLGGTGSGIDLMIYGLLVVIMALNQPKGIIQIISNLQARNSEKKSEK